MNNLFTTFFTTLFKESNFNLASCKTNTLIKNKVYELYIAQKSKGDYYIYLYIDTEDLKYVTDHIQIELRSIIEHEFNKFKHYNETPVTIKSSFDKNTTLIIASTYNANNENEVNSRIVEIEEDQYFFKKQVLLVRESDEQIIRNYYNKYNEKLIKNLNKTITDVNLFNEFSKGKVNNYNFVAKLYEKIPFLKFDIKENPKKNLIEDINNCLSEDQRLLRDELLLINPEDIDSWIKNLNKDDIND